MEFTYPLVLLLISPIILVGLYAMRKGVSKLLIISRIIILSLLIVALASPFTFTMTTEKDEVPKIVVISDNTFSMDLFEKEVGKEIFESLKSKTPTTLREFNGIISPIGDEIIQDSEVNNNIVLVSDGYSNYGKDLFDAIDFVNKNTGTRVFAVRQETLHNDASIEIESPKNLIIGNENVFNVIIRQAGSETSYRLDVSIDGKSVISETYKQTERIKIIPVSYTFTSLGKHEITAKITPSSEDWFNINNIFYSSVFVVPKPKILVITDETSSPFYTITDSLYDVTRKNSIPDDLKTYRTVIIDNKEASSISADNLRTYISGGGGLVVVGGDVAYDKGNYNNSPFESILPIISKAGSYEGGRNLVIVIDSSGSTATEDFTTGISFIGLIDANAISILQNVQKDSRVGIVAFGGDIAKTSILPMGSEANKKELEDFIKKIGPKGGDNPTDLDKGLRFAEELLNSAGGTKEIIVISDGLMPPEGMQQIKNTVVELNNNGVKIHFVQILTSFETIKTPYGLYGELAKAISSEVTVLNPDERASTLIQKDTDKQPTPTPTPDISFEFPLVAIESNHFITKYVNLTAPVTGYNDVVPKLGGSELVATSKGSPILTTWGFGLGRVVAFSSDNGGGETRWASGVYSGENSRLISSMINWAIGDPRSRDGVVIEAQDMWAGTSGKILVTSDILPQIKLDGVPLSLSRTGDVSYETSVLLEKDGFHDLSGYGIAVNYPLEYKDIGFNEKLNTVIASNGGKVYNKGDVESLLLLDIKEKATRAVQKPKSEKEIFLLAALLLFLIEVIVRRLKDYRKERPKNEKAS